MKQAPPALTPLLRTDLQGDLLSTLFLHPDEEFSLSDLSRRLGAGGSTIHTEVGRLATSGLLDERRIGRARLVRANREHPLAPSLTELLTLTYGPAAVLPRLLDPLRGLQQAYLYGSWAARRSGVHGPFPGDVDVLVVGAVSSRAAARVQNAATEALRREVNLTVVDADEWDHPTTGFTKTVKDGPLVPLLLSAMSTTRDSTRPDEHDTRLNAP